MNSAAVIEITKPRPAFEPITVVGGVISYLDWLGRECARLAPSPDWRALRVRKRKDGLVDLVGIYLGDLAAPERAYLTRSAIAAPHGSLRTHAELDAEINERDGAGGES